MSDKSVKTFKPSDITSDMLVVDIRTQMNYDLAHYNNAISLFFPQILWKRLIRKKTLDDFLIGKTQILRERHNGTFIVLYDDCTTEINMSDSSNPLCILSEIFLNEGTQFAFIEGGFKALKNAFPDMIVNSPCQSFYKPTLSLKSSPLELDPFTMPLNFFLDNFMAIGSETHAQNISLMDTLKITHILNVTPNETLEDIKKGRQILQIPILDTISQNIIEYLSKALKFIHNARATPNAKLLIHCYAGISRSVSFAIAYVMWTEHKSFEDAFALIHKHRPCASPNLNFIGQLMIFGNFLQNTEEMLSPTTATTRASEYLKSQ